jgi:hypothetical protein
MRTSARWWQAAGLTAALLSLPATVGAGQGQQAAPKPPDNETCLACHGDPALVGSTGKRLGVDGAKFGGSIHGNLGLACVDCHADLKTTSEFPHAEKLGRVDCSGCHDVAVASYNRSIHAFARRQDAASVAATCADCHTPHEIRAARDPASTTYALNLPATCSRCHGDPAIIKQGHIAIGNVADMYKDSIHGRAVSRSGLLVAANCTSCHGSHDIRPSADALSRVNRANIPATCGACHEGIKTQYAAGVHGTASSSGNGRAPVCADCHSAHQIQRADVSAWQLDVIRECGTCHVSNIRTYRDTFHGQVTSLGFVRVATCAACHGAHAILPSADERSMTSKARVLSTCQQCHPNATEGFAQYDPHADKHNRDRNPVLYYASQFMTWLLFGVFGFFGLHAVLWLPRGFAERRRQRLREEPRPEDESHGD